MRSIFGIIFALTLALMNTGAHAAPKAKTKKSSARTSSHADIHILSYQQLMRLTPSRRMMYFADLRKLMVILEKQISQFETAGLDASILKEQVASMMQALDFMPAASAASTATAVAAAADESQLPQWDAQNKKWTCDSSKGLIFLQDSGTCVLGANGSATEFRDSDGDCPGGAWKIPDPTWFHGPTLDFHHSLFENYHLCVPEANWDKVPVKRRTAVMAHEWLGGTYFDGKSRESTSDMVGAGGFETYSSGPATSPDVANMTSPSSAPSSATSSSTSAAAAPATDPAATITQAADSSSTAPASACADQKFACDSVQPGSDEFNKDEAAFRHDNRPEANVCVYGGFFSQYRTNEKKRGNCLGVRKFPSSGPAIASCSNPSEVLCNPVLFCLSTDVGQIDDPKSPGQKETVSLPHTKCVPKRDPATGQYDVTNRCNGWYEGVRTSGSEIFTYNAAKAGEAPKMVTTTKPVPTKVCDPMGGVKFINANAQDEWNAMKDNLDKQFDTWCSPGQGDQNFQALFCSECKIMAAIRSRATGKCDVVPNAITPQPKPTPSTKPATKPADSTTTTDTSTQDDSADPSAVGPQPATAD